MHDSYDAWTSVHWEAAQALSVNLNAAKGLQEALRMWLRTAVQSRICKPMHFLLHKLTKINPFSVDLKIIQRAHFPRHFWMAAA